MQNKNKSLAIISTGSFRVFFKNDEFIQLLKRCKLHYEFIYIFLVINDEINEEVFIKLNTLFENVELQNNYEIIDFKPFINVLNQCNLKKKENEKYNKLRNEYLQNNHSKAKEFLSDPNEMTIYSKCGGSIHNKNTIIGNIEWLDLATIQFYQLKIGIENLLEYEKNTNMKFDIIMKTRLDLDKYPDEFYPYVPNEDESVMNKISFGRQNIKSVIDTKLSELNSNKIEDFIEYLKNQKIISPNIFSDDMPHNFGGMYFNNYISLENINNGDNNILYSINDHFYFSKRDIFIKLKDFYDNFALLDNEPDILHYYAPESQFLLYCFQNNINILMYWGKTHYPKCPNFWI